LVVVVKMVEVKMGMVVKMVDTGSDGEIVMRQKIVGCDGEDGNGSKDDWMVVVKTVGCDGEDGWL
jgi:hypothetical protein